MRNNISKMDYTDVKNTYVIWDFFVTIKKCPHVHFVYSCFSQMIPLGLYEKQCRIFSIPEIRTCIVIYGQETSHDNIAVVIRAQILTVNGDSVSKSGFYLWGVT